MARFSKCLQCREPKKVHDFRTSNRNLKRHSICYKCRKVNPDLEIKTKQIFNGTNRKESFLTIKRRKSKFRKLFHSVARSLFIRRKRRKNTEVWMSVKKQTNDYILFPERVAAIIGKTFSVRGDDFEFSDDEANLMIKDLLDELDPKLIERNKKKRLSRMTVQRNQESR